MEAGPAHVIGSAGLCGAVSEAFLVCPRSLGRGGSRVGVRSLFSAPFPQLPGPGNRNFQRRALDPRVWGTVGLALVPCPSIQELAWQGGQQKRLLLSPHCSPAMGPAGAGQSSEFKCRLCPHAPGGKGGERALSWLRMAVPLKTASPALGSHRGISARMPSPHCEHRRDLKKGPAAI